MDSDSSSRNQLKRVSVASGGLVILLGIAVLLGWAFDIEILKAVWPGLATMKANTAICFVLAGIALCLATLTKPGGWRWHIVRLLGLAILLISALSLAADVFGFNPGIDQMFFRDLASTRAPGRMSPATAFNWIAVGATLMLMATERKRWRELAQWPALLVALVSLVALAGYLYNARQLYAFGPFASVALHTAIAFLIVATGLLCVPPHGSLVRLIRSHRLGGTAARLLLPVVICLPLIGGWIRLEAQRVGWIGTDLGTGLFATALVVMLVGIIWATAQAIEIIDVRRERAVERLRASEKKFADAFQTSPAGITITRIADGRFIDVNEAFLTMFGFTREEVIGHTSIELNLFNPKERDRLIAAQVESGGLRNAELSARSKSGKQVNILFSSKPIEWEGETHHITTLIDITERKQAEAALRETQEQLESALAAGSVGTWVWDLVNNRAYADEYLSELFSIPSDADAEGGALDIFFQAIDEADRPRVQEAIERTIKFDEKYEIEYRVLPADKKPRWLLGRGRIDRDAAGNALRFLGMSMDITDRKQAETALRESEEKFRALADHSIQGIVLLQDERTTFINQACCAITGYSREEALAQTAAQRFEIVHPDDRARAIDRQRRFERGEPIEEVDELRIRRKDGEERWVLASNKSFTLQGKPARLGIVIDITDRKRAEAALRESEVRLRRILDTMFVFVGLITLEWEIVEVNQSPLDAAGLKREDVLGRKVPETYWYSHSPVVQAQVRVALARAAQGEIVREDFTIRVASERNIVIDLTLAPLRDAEGRVTQIVGSAVDITARKQAEAELRASTDQLRALSARLLAAREEEGTRIAREIHDELGGALTGFKWDLEELERTLAGANNGEGLGAARDRIPMLADNIDSTIDVVRRISAELRPGVLDDLGLVAAVEWQAQQFQQRTGLTAQCELCGDVDLARDRAIAVFRVFQEILTNVMRHAQATRIDIKMAESDGALMLEVKDDGRGISETERENRSSLGLLGMHERVQLVGGEIEISGASGKGTRVVVSVPLA